MSNVIDFLEHIGRDASLHFRARHDIERLLADAGVEPALRDAVVKGQCSRLEELLGAKTNMCCLIHVPDGGGEDEGYGLSANAFGVERERSAC